MFKIVEDGWPKRECHEVMDVFEVGEVYITIA